MTLEQIKSMRYQGGGYFRLPGPKGVVMPIMHAPSVHAILVEEIDRLQRENDALQKKLGEKDES